MAADVRRDSRMWKLRSHILNLKPEAERAERMWQDGKDIQIIFLLMYFL